MTHRVKTKTRGAAVRRVPAREAPGALRGVV